MTLLKGFAAGTPGFGPCKGKYGALAVSKALELSKEPTGKAQVTALLEAAGQVRVCALTRIKLGFRARIRSKVRVSLRARIRVVVANIRQSRSCCNCVCRSCRKLPVRACGAGESSCGD